MRWMALALLPLAACTDTNDDAPPTPTGDSGTDGPVNPNPLPMEDTSAALTARVVDADGDPVEGAAIRFCRGPECRFADSDADGRFGFADVVVDWHSLEVVPPQGTPGLATAFAPIVFGTEETRSVDLVMPSLDSPIPLPTTAEAIQVAEGLTITVGLGNLKPPLFVDPATEVAGVRLTPDQWVPVDEEQGTVVAQWFLSPFDHKAEVDIPMAFTNNYDLPDYTELKVIVGDYTTSDWLEAGTMTVDGGALVGTVNLPVVSTVVLVRTN